MAYGGFINGRRGGTREEFFPLTGGCSEGLGAFRFFFKLGRNPVSQSKHQIQPEYGDEQADAGRDG